MAIQVKVYRNGEALKGARVQTTWDSSTVITNDQGCAVFPGVPKSVRSVFVNGMEVKEDVDENGMLVVWL
ncbi:MAG: hypothetical protein HGB00_00625 [Chlorobiaceae bacterium]|nr:hypothetical protein [Chlorobiaceae bacterium]